MRTALLALPLGLLLLTGCSSSPEAEVREGVRSVLAAANDQDADAVRTAVDDLLTTLREQVGSSELTDAEAAPVRDAARAVLESVTVLDQAEQTPTPTPEPTDEPEPTEEPEPTPTTPTPTPEPTQEPEQTEPPETEEPEETEGPEQTQPPEDEGDGEDDDQATVAPQQPAVTSSPGPTPTA